VLDKLVKTLESAGVPHFTVLMAELSLEKLRAFGVGSVGAWVQVACPRLSIDWGEAVEAGVGAPLLTPYEAFEAADGQFVIQRQAARGTPHGRAAGAAGTHPVSPASCTTATLPSGCTDSSRVPQPAKTARPLGRDPWIKHALLKSSWSQQHGSVACARGTPPARQR
jgi:hypothetical protein